MTRSFVLAVAVLLTGGFLHTESDAVTISRQNPYRSFNISGINYGSTQWEKSRRQGNYAQRRSGGIVIRRR